LLRRELVWATNHLAAPPPRSLLTRGVAVDLGAENSGPPSYPKADKSANKLYELELTLFADIKINQQLKLPDRTGSLSSTATARSP
jgi:hypothetical protein